jgi:ADP-ribose pyrophosphatase YjhB (NUDIX family)
MTTKEQQGAFIEKVPDGDNRTRLVCPDCGYVEYTNPKIVVGAVCTWEDRVLLCRRAIAPSLGLWTIPAGYMETGETTAEGAAREVWEEARARVTIDGLVGLYEIPHIAQVNVIYRAPMSGPEHAPGEESEAVHLFRWEEIPWDELAFPSIRWALEQFRANVSPAVHAFVRHASPSPGPRPEPCPGRLAGPLLKR